MKAKFLPISLSLIGLILGVSAVALSLSLASQVSSHESSKLSARELYWGEEILPDHLLYPGMMFMDRVQLDRAEPTERTYMQVVYAGRRLLYAQELLAKGKEELAVTTLTKSQKYLLQAGRDTLNSHADNRELLTYVLKAYAFHHRELDTIRQQLSETAVLPLDSLTEECDFVFARLLELYQAEAGITL
jgi:hypothetical protein